MPTENPSKLKLAKNRNAYSRNTFTPEMLKLGGVTSTKVKVLLLVLVCVFNIDLFEFSAAILEKGLVA